MRTRRKKKRSRNFQLSFFVFVQKQVRKMFSNLDAVVSSKVHFVGIASGTLNDYENRRSRGSPALLIHSNKLEKLSTLFRHIDNFSAEDGKNAAIVFHSVIDKNLGASKFNSSKNVQ